MHLRFIFIQGHCTGARGLAHRAREGKKSLSLLTLHNLTQLWIWSSGFLLNKGWNNFGFAFVYITYQWGTWDTETSQNGIKTSWVSIYHLPKEIEGLAPLSLQQPREEAGRSGFFNSKRPPCWKQHQFTDVHRQETRSGSQNTQKGIHRSLSSGWNKQKQQPECSWIQEALC